jgi:glycerol-3-phosphate acyltransferase PlsY
MNFLLLAAVCAAAYVIGSFPTGLIFVKLFTGKNIQTIESGRIGGTNAMRAAGYGIGILTVVVDIVKGASTAWLARAVFPENPFIHIISPILGIMGHNNSLFLLRKGKNGELEAGGGAGGTPALGGAVGLWWPAVLILFPGAVLIFFGVGYASVTTLSVPLIATLIFAIRYLTGSSPWQYILYGLAAEVLIILALRPNIKRLINGTERVVGWRAKWREKRSSSSESPDAEN